MVELEFGSIKRFELKVRDLTPGFSLKQIRQRIGSKIVPTTMVAGKIVVGASLAAGAAALAGARAGGQAGLRIAPAIPGAVAASFRFVQARFFPTVPSTPGRLLPTPKGRTVTLLGDAAIRAQQGATTITATPQVVAAIRQASRAGARGGGGGGCDCFAANLSTACQRLCSGS